MCLYLGFLCESGTPYDYVVLRDAISVKGEGRVRRGGGVILWEYAVRRPRNKSGSQS